MRFTALVVISLLLAPLFSFIPGTTAQSEPQLFNADYSGSYQAGGYGGAVDMEISLEKSNKIAMELSLGAEGKEGDIAQVVIDREVTSLYGIYDIERGKVNISAHFPLFSSMDDREKSMHMIFWRDINYEYRGVDEIMVGGEKFNTLVYVNWTCLSQRWYVNTTAGGILVKLVDRGAFGKVTLNLDEINWGGNVEYVSGQGGGDIVALDQAPDIESALPVIKERYRAEELLGDIHNDGQTLEFGSESIAVDEQIYYNIAQSINGLSGETATRVAVATLLVHSPDFAALADNGARDAVDIIRSGTASPEGKVLALAALLIEMGYGAEPYLLLNNGTAPVVRLFMDGSFTFLDPITSMVPIDGSGLVPGPEIGEWLISVISSEGGVEYGGAISALIGQYSLVELGEGEAVKDEKIQYQWKKLFLFYFLLFFALVSLFVGSYAGKYAGRPRTSGAAKGMVAAGILALVTLALWTVWDVLWNHVYLGRSAVLLASVLSSTALSLYISLLCFVKGSRAK